MMYKKSSEIQKIFGLSRDDVNRLDKDGILKPNRSGQGIASKFSSEDLFRLLDVKIYLLAGYRISDMKTILTDSYDADLGISEQIHIYKKRIQMLEFIRTMRADIKEWDRISPKQVSDFNEITAQNINLPDYGSDEYYEVVWGYMELFFLMDFLSQRESLTSEKEEVINRIYGGYELVKRIFELSGTQIDKAIEEIITMSNDYDEDDMDVKELIKELTDEILSKKEQIVEELEQEFIVRMTHGAEESMVQVYKKSLKHFWEFSLSYFVNEESLYCIYRNLKKFAQSLDLKALEQGIVRLERRKHGGKMG